MDDSLYVGFSASNSLFGTLIRIFSGTLAGSGVTHMTLVYFDEKLDTWMTLGAVSSGFAEMTLKDFRKSRKLIVMFKPANPNVNLWAGLKAIRDKINAHYGWAAVAGLGLAEIAEHLFKRTFRNPLDNDREVFCSEVGSEVIRQTLDGGFPPKPFSFLPNTPADEITPQMAYHELVRRPDFVQGELPT